MISSLTGWHTLQTLPFLSCPTLETSSLIKRWYQIKLASSLSKYEMKKSEENRTQYQFNSFHYIYVSYHIVIAALNLTTVPDPHNVRKLPIYLLNDNTLCSGVKARDQMVSSGMNKRSTFNISWRRDFLTDNQKVENTKLLHTFKWCLDDFIAIFCIW